MQYNELLKTDNWKIKRTEILKRDNHECQRCGISKLNNFHGKILSLGKNIEEKYKIIFFNDENLNTNLVSIKTDYGFELICKSNIHNSQIKKNQEYVITINFCNQKFIKYPFNGSTIDNIKNNIFLEKSTNNLLINTVKSYLLKQDNIDIDIEAFWLIEYGAENYSCKDGNNLHVHHKCYRKDIEIWNQKDEDYITLCSVCHEIVHINQMIPFYDKFGMVIQYMQPCTKCNGTGYLKHYNHILNGICFNCNGFGSVTDFLNF